MAHNIFSVITLYFPCTDTPTPPPIATPVITSFNNTIEKKGEKNGSKGIGEQSTSAREYPESPRRSARIY
jgi:hypothetical protein